jgi:predicted nucleotidyltransferase component of viral defense system
VDDIAQCLNRSSGGEPLISRYPASFSTIAAWAAENKIPVSEARRRFAQYGILQSIAGSQVLSSSLVFKGGNALDFIWQPNRSTLDLDFSSRDSTLTIDRIEAFFEPSLQRVSTASGTLYRLQRVEQQPPGKGRSFITFNVSIGYALPDDLRNQQRIREKKSSLASIPVEISLNEPICAAEEIELASANLLQVSTQEDIVAEKLRALLQQVPRNRTRPQDVLDITVALNRGANLRPDVVADFLRRKAASRNVEVSLNLFLAEELWRRAEQGYAELQSTARDLFVPFESAKEILLAFIKTLPL